ncbi:hypothetical protein E3T40_04045 [Cryobacterium sp. TMT1-19]|uniref:hypothetical protein n=1 Tax=Cryobacterium sp. TMT1-19 TaxID=1259231 RepID=UPI00106AB492|nr:hypothetical protein [Cryobacterium sp. TMT1-19]TFD37769.1 hypothetical protein E3T40_04045 [Cryobacterium sp. TMT1-19]
MHNEYHPSELHDKARGLWTLAGDRGDSSALYERADGRVAREGIPLHDVISRRAANWAEALYRYEHFWRVNGRSPRENTRDRSSLPPEERRMGEWARHQRRFDDRLSSYQKVRLDVSPAYEWDPLESVWQAHLAECEQHGRTTGRLPRLHAADPAEFALARWLGRQLRQLQQRTLPDSRATQVEGLLARRIEINDSPCP